MVCYSKINRRKKGVLSNKIKKCMKKIFHQYKHAWVLLYFFIYLIWFFYLNQMTADSFHPIEVPLDASIPFIEAFIVPYYLWFPYIPLTIFYFFFTSKKEYYQCTAFLFIGMTICLIIYSIYPNGVYFRPDLDALGRDNLFISLTKIIYDIDPGTNVCPSIHSFNSIGAYIAIHKSEKLKKYHWVRILSFLLTVSICLSTVFIKQHSIFDVYMAMILAAVMYLLVYKVNYRNLGKKLKLQKAN